MHVGSFKIFYGLWLRRFWPPASVVRQYFCPLLLNKNLAEVTLRSSLVNLPKVFINSKRNTLSQIVIIF